MLNTESEISKGNDLIPTFHKRTQIKPNATTKSSTTEVTHSCTFFFFKKDHHPTHPTHPPTLKREKNSQLGEPNHLLLRERLRHPVDVPIKGKGWDALTLEPEPYARSKWKTVKHRGRNHAVTRQHTHSTF